MGNTTDEERIQRGLIEQSYYDQDFDKDDIRNYYRERGKIRRERYLHLLENIQNMPDSSALEQCAKLRKYYGFSWVYKKNLSDLLYEWSPSIRQKFLDIKVLSPYKDTVWLDKDRLKEFEEFIYNSTSK